MAWSVSFYPQVYINWKRKRYFVCVTVITKFNCYQGWEAIGALKYCLWVKYGGGVKMVTRESHGA